MFFREIISVFGDVGGGEENLTGHMNTCWKNPLKQKFNYLGCELNLDGEPDFDKKKKKINKQIKKICGTLKKYLKKTRTDTQMKFYKVVARPSLLYGSETCVTMS